MAANPHLAAAPVESGAPLDRAAAVAILVHGRTQSPDVMLELARRLALRGTHYVLPVADGASWYPGRYYDPQDALEPSLSHALDAYDAVVERLAEAG
ncbi:MAG: hypothetical protein ACXWZZ_09330, partial [Solirubrobacteraceae bacterium]